MIYGQRIRLRAMEREDLPLFVQWFNDPEVHAGIAVFLPMSQSEEERWFEQMLESPPPEHSLMIEVKSDAGWKAIGDCGFHKIDWRNRSAEIGIMIGEKSYWNQGYGRESVGLLLSHGFNSLNLNRIFLRVFATNPRAIRSYEKAGFVHEGRFRQAEFRNGSYVDVLFMSVLRSEWQGANQLNP